MTPLQIALRILALIIAFFLIGLLVWLFYCRCRRGAIEPGTVGQQMHYAMAQPQKLEGGRPPAFTRLYV